MNTMVCKAPKAEARRPRWPPSSMPSNSLVVVLQGDGARDGSTGGEGGPIMTPSDPKQTIADAIRLRVVTVSLDQSNYAAEDVLARLTKAGYELRKK